MPVLNTAAASLTAAAILRNKNVSQAAAAAIATGLLQDLILYGVLPENYSHLACDPNKLLRTRRKVMDKAKKIDQENLAKRDKISAVYFDGRRDNTVSMIPDARGQLHRRILKENHTTVTVEPEGRYLDHFTPLELFHPENQHKKKPRDCLNFLISMALKSPA